MCGKERRKKEEHQETRNIRTPRAKERKMEPEGIRCWAALFFPTSSMEGLISNTVT